MSDKIPAKTIKDLDLQRQDHISYDIKKQEKRISNMNFENFSFNDSDNSNSYINTQIEIPSSKLRKIKLNNNYRTPLTLVFDNCDFDLLDIKSINNNIIFQNCNILTLLIDKCTLLSKESKFQITGGFIKELAINETAVKGKFYINKQDEENKESTIITKLSIKKTIFEENFKLHKCKIDEVAIEDTDFIKNADFYMSIFASGTLTKNQKDNIKNNDIRFKSINFESLALFGDTEFKKKLIFKYVTFKGHNHFKSAKLHKGLDLEYTNIQNEINFYGLNILDTSTTSQETYRVIKHQFEKLGNKIEANKYHALELEQKGKELEKEPSKNWQEYLVFKLHAMSSEHSTNWLLALLWIVMIGFLTTILEKSPYLLNVLPLSFLFAFALFEKVTSRLMVFLIFFALVLFFSNEIFLKDIMQNMSLINLNSTPEPEIIKEAVKSQNWWKTFVVFLNKISLGYLYYQFVMSVRKDTRK